jgi:hypothetical protein
LQRSRIGDWNRSHTGKLTKIKRRLGRIHWITNWSNSWKTFERGAESTFSRRPEENASLYQSIPIELPVKTFRSWEPQRVHPAKIDWPKKTIFQWLPILIGIKQLGNWEPRLARRHFWSEQKPDCLACRGRGKTLTSTRFPKDLGRPFQGTVYEGSGGINAGNGWTEHSLGQNRRSKSSSVIFSKCSPSLNYVSWGFAARSWVPLPMMPIRSCCWQDNQPRRNIWYINRDTESQVICVWLRFAFKVFQIRDILLIWI